MHFIDKLGYCNGYILQIRNHHPICKEKIKKQFKTKTYSSWKDIFSGFDVSVDPVLKMSELIDHPHFKARKMFVDVPTPDGSYQKQMGSAIKFSESQNQYLHVGKELGKDTEDILASLS